MIITINGQTFLATLHDNETAAALKEKMPLTLDMSELNGNEKYMLYCVSKMAASKIPFPQSPFLTEQSKCLPI